jgi:hypothetical protein
MLARDTVDAVRTSELRAAIKTHIPDARVARTGGDSWTVRFASPSHLKTIRELIKALGLKELYHDVEGSRWDWSYVFHVVVKD